MTTWGLGETILNGLARDGGLYVPKNALPKPTTGTQFRITILHGIIFLRKTHLEGLRDSRNIAAFYGAKYVIWFELELRQYKSILTKKKCLF